MYVHTRERDRRAGFDSVEIKFYYYNYIMLQSLHAAVPSMWIPSIDTN